MNYSKKDIIGAIEKAIKSGKYNDYNIIWLNNYKNSLINSKNFEEWIKKQNNILFISYLKENNYL